jgi:hypothetical protein
MTNTEPLNEPDASETHVLSWEPYGDPPLDRFMGYLVNMSRVMDISIRGIGMSIPMVNLAKAVDNVKAVSRDERFPHDLAKSEKRIRRIEQDAEFARDQVAKDFPLLNGLALVGTWGALEAFIEDLAAGWIGRYPEILEEDSFARIKIPFVRFNALDDDERRTFLVREISGANRQSGISGFEDLLGKIGLGGKVEDEIRKDIFEMHQIRNLIVHRASVADRKFVEDCPWLNCRIGEDIAVTSARLRDFQVSVIRYLRIIQERMTAQVRLKKGLPAVPSAK